jgi:hypothetical protein
MHHDDSFHIYFYILFAIFICLILTILLIQRTIRKEREKTEKMIMRILILVALICAPAISEDLPPFIQHGGGPAPVALPELSRAGAAMADLIGEEAAVNATHWLFMYGNYENGSWVLNNTTVG